MIRILPKFPFHQNKKNAESLLSLITSSKIDTVDKISRKDSSSSVPNKGYDMSCIILVKNEGMLLTGEQG